jgi:hypothetical protein
MMFWSRTRTQSTIFVTKSAIRPPIAGPPCQTRPNQFTPKESCDLLFHVSTALVTVTPRPCHAAVRRRRSARPPCANSGRLPRVANASRVVGLGLGTTRSCAAGLQVKLLNVSRSHNRKRRRRDASAVAFCPRLAVRCRCGGRTDSSSGVHRRGARQPRRGSRSRSRSRDARRPSMSSRRAPETAPMVIPWARVAEALMNAGATCCRPRLSPSHPCTRR